MLPVIIKVGSLLQQQPDHCQIRRAMALDDAGADIIAVDCAHAHKPSIVKFAKTHLEG